MWLNFIPTKNKWSDIGGGCCDKYCCNSNNPVCVEGNAFFNINDENVNYVAGKCSNGVIFVYAENSFKNPQDYFNYSLYYFEIKSKFEGEYSELVDWIYVGLGGRRNLSSDKHIWYSAKNATITNEKFESFKISTVFNNNDIFGCGIVYPPTNMMNEFPYVFFTQNGKQIGKGILIKDDFVSYPFVRLKDFGNFGHEFFQAISLKENFDTSVPIEWLRCCSVEANFGNDLKLKPFCYDITKHFVLKEFYEDSDVD
uniref:Uncharacterized protein n=1 Tax=Meloidogyne enterolobii TaxID=390850 RepID=A0A6V7W8Z3_MELEN|nr:unnamed protein product [Meloidogyne enterolobii]